MSKYKVITEKGSTVEVEASNFRVDNNGLHFFNDLTTSVATFKNYKYTYLVDSLISDE